MKQAAHTLREHGRLIQATEIGPGHYQLLRWHLPEISQQARPGTLIQINNRSHPIMRSAPGPGWVEMLANDSLPVSDQSELDVTADLSQAFELIEERPQMLLIGAESGIAAIVYLAEQLKKQQPITPLILLGFDSKLPFRPQPSRIMTPDLPAHVIATMPLLEDWNMPCRIAHSEASPGCFEGHLDELADYWLERQTNMEQINIYACAGKPTCDEINRIANGLSLPCQTIELD